MGYFCNRFFISSMESICFDKQKFIRSQENKIEWYEHISARME